MSILIKGMDMPKNCGGCPFLYAKDACYLSSMFSGGNFYLLCSNGHNDEYQLGMFPFKEKRVDWCPLIEIPPHGRLIDADALHIDLMDRGIEDIQMNDWYEIQQAVDDAPTIIEADSMQRNDSNALGALESEEEDG